MKSTDKIQGGKMKALDLFGGRRAVSERACKLLRKAIGSKTGDELIQLEVDLGVRERVFSDILHEVVLDIADIRKILAPLKIIWDAILETPKFKSPEEKADWDREFRDSPMIVAGCAGPGDSTKVEITQLTFLTLRAIQEISKKSN